MDNEVLRQLIEAGIDCHVSGDAAGALACYTNALEIDPTNTLVIFNMGCLFEEAGRHTEATEAFYVAAVLERRKSEQDPDIAQAVKNFGKRGIN